MKIIISIFVFIFSTNLFAIEWKQTSPETGINYYKQGGFEIIDSEIVRNFKYNDVVYETIRFKLQNSAYFVICLVSSKDYKPHLTQCFSENSE